MQCHWSARFRQTPGLSAHIAAHTPHWCVTAVHADDASLKAALPTGCTQLSVELWLLCLVPKFLRCVRLPSQMSAVVMLTMLALL